MIEAINDSVALVARHMRHIRRTPEQLLGLTVMPVAFVVVFGLLFGSAMSVPGPGGYQEFIMAGIFVQVMLGNILTTAVGVATDLGNGLVDRFRSLPIARLSVLTGRTVSDAILTSWTCLVMAGVGFLIGWRTHNGLLPALAGFGLVILFGFAMSWLGVVIGLTVRNPEAVTALTGVLMMPLAFLSNAFVPLDGLPAWLRVLAEWNPVSAVVTACRTLFGNETGASTGSVLAAHSIPFALVLIGMLLITTIPLARRAYQKAAAS